MYDIFLISTDHAYIKILKEKYPLIRVVDSFKMAQKRAFTKMFWVIWSDIIVNDTFNFEYEIPTWDEQYIHVFQNDGDSYGICLFPKNAKVSDRELKYGFFLDSKPIHITASTHKLYDKFYVDTYEEYLDALTNTTTEMFWIIPRDIQVEIGRAHV